MAGENIDGQHPRPPVLAILLEIIEREKFDRLLAYCQIRQYFPLSKQLRYIVRTYICTCITIVTSVCT